MTEQAQAPSIVKATLISYVNHGLTLLFAYLAQKGLRADGILTPEAIQAPAGASLEQVKTEAAAMPLIAK